MVIKFLWLLWLNYWWVLVMELEVIYNYSGVKNFRRKSCKKNTRPLRFWQTDFWFQTGFLHNITIKVTMPRDCVFYMETKVFLCAPLKYIISKKGINKNKLSGYTPANKSARLQPIASDIFFSLLIFVRSVNWFIKFLFTRISLQRSVTVLFLSLSSFFIFSTILFFNFMCLFGRILYYSCVYSGQI